MKPSIASILNDTLKPEFDKKGMDMASFPKNDSLITAGIIDSITFVNILLTLETKLDISLDFGSVDLNGIVSINGMNDFFIKNGAE